MARPVRIAEAPKPDAHRDRGCKYNDWVWGVPEGESRCEWCAFHDCIKNQERGAVVRLKDLYFHGQDFAKFLHKYRGLSISQLSEMFGWHPVTMERIINGMDSSKS
jgi:hypothetical protein